MRQSTVLKKAEDWHPADVISALRKAGWSLRQIALSNNYGDLNVVSRALHRPYPKAERLIADALGVTPESIWPSRYDNGIPNRRKGPPPMRPAQPHGRAETRAATTQK